MFVNCLYGAATKRPQLAFLKRRRYLAPHAEEALEGEFQARKQELQHARALVDLGAIRGGRSAARRLRREPYDLVDGQGTRPRLVDCLAEGRVPALRQLRSEE